MSDMTPLDEEIVRLRKVNTELNRSCEDSVSMAMKYHVRAEAAEAKVAAALALVDKRIEESLPQKHWLLVRLRAALTEVQA